MPRTYSFDHFQAKKPMQAAVGTPGRLGNDEDKQKPLKSEFQEMQPDSVPGAHQGEIHYGMAHSETVKRLQERRAARAKKEARAKAATKRPTGARKAAAKGSGCDPDNEAARRSPAQLQTSDGVRGAIAPRIPRRYRGQATYETLQS